jgi:hypothetical protein
MSTDFLLGQQNFSIFNMGVSNETDVMPYCGWKYHPEEEEKGFVRSCGHAITHSLVS